MPVGQVHCQGRRILTGVGGVHLMSRNLRRTIARRTMRQARGLRQTPLEASGKGVSGHGNDQPAADEGRPQLIEVLMTRQVHGLQRLAHLRTDGAVVVGEGGRCSQKTLQLGPCGHGRRHLGVLRGLGRRVADRRGRWCGNCLLILR